MKCEVFNTNDVEKNPGNCVFLDYMTSHMKHARHRFWYTEKMLNYKLSGLVTLLFFILFMCIIGFKLTSYKIS